MTVDEIKDLKNEIQDVLGKIIKIIHYINKGQYYLCHMISNTMWNELADLIDKLAVSLDEINGENVVASIDDIILTIKELQEAQEREDFVYLADIYEMKLLKILTSIQEVLVSALGVWIDDELLKKNIVSCKKNNLQILMSLFPESVIDEAEGENVFSDEAIEVITEMVEKSFSKGFVVEPTSSGYFTTAVENNGKHYIHTNGQIVREALIQAEEWLNQGKEEYTVYGLGFGYPYMEMLEIDFNITVNVIETNRDMILLAMIFSPMYKLFDSSQFTLIYDPRGRKLNATSIDITEEKGFYVFHPSINTVSRENIKDGLRQYFVEESSIRIHSRNLYGNFRKNLRRNDKGFNELKSKLKGKEIVLVAAGPSLDENVDCLKNKGKNTVIVAAGTILKKLLNKNIIPDFVVIIDSGRPTYKQIEGIEDCKVPLIYLSTVFSPIPSNYAGEKYILFQNGFWEAEKYAEKKGEQLFETGGSVMTLAFDMCLKVEPNKIIFAGLDLAVKGGKDHADDTQNSALIVRDTGVYVEGVKEKKVETTRNLKIYLDWINNRMTNLSEEEKKIEIYDATEGGAKKKNMILGKLRDLV